MRGNIRLCMAASLAVMVVAPPVAASGRDVLLPKGVKAVWDLGNAYREATPTRERISINGLWRWQPADDVGGAVPTDNWGYYKVPAPWSSNCQTLYANPAWKSKNLQSADVAWYQREISIPSAWQGRRIAIYAEYLNSYAAVYLDGKKWGTCTSPRVKSILPAPPSLARRTFCRCASRPCPWPP